jgi:uncharacterized protein YkwD
MTAKIKSVPKSTGHKYKPKNVSTHEFAKVHWPYLPILLVIFVILSLGFKSGTLGTLLHHPTGKVLGYSTSMQANDLLSATNDARSHNGAGPLKLNGELDTAAQAKANDMANRNYWNHVTPEGNQPWTFVNTQNYNYKDLGENLAAGFNNEKTTVTAWMASPSHRENMLNSIYSDVGFGFANNPNYTSAGGGPMTIVVAFYGTPASGQVAGTTKNPNAGQTLSYRTSKAQLAFAGSTFSNLATGIFILGIFAAVGAWISRHALNVRKAFARSESFTIRHPLIDVGLLVIVGLSFFMTQTAGFIK